jgi:starch synthase (maltosyl-transferring)
MQKAKRKAARGGLTVPGRPRVVIEGMRPKIDGGRFAIKRVTGEEVVVEADVFADGHDSLSAVLQWRRVEDADWVETAMAELSNDRWRGSFEVGDPGQYVYRVIGWVDAFKSWHHDLKKRVAALQDVGVELLVGAGLVRAAAGRAKKGDAAQLRTWAGQMADSKRLALAERVAVGLGSGLSELMRRYPDREHATISEPELSVVVDPPLARCGAWYEFFPRSASPEAGRHGTFRDCRVWLERAKRMGFDVVYFPPIHPVGEAFRKGKNNEPTCEPGDVGSPWGIGARAGGHKSVLADLGTRADFRALVRQARGMGLTVAMDIAFQCSPDHPYVRSNPEWFRKRPDGSIQYAENPPKKYQDIYPFDFETKEWESLWKELKSVFEFWVKEGVTVFRVDNPHTKSFAFWEWCIGELKRKNPELIFLSEAFTRPKVMYLLAKLGFTQSYNYFPWRNTKTELEEYLTELTRTEVAEYMRPNLWPNTPDILPQILQDGGRPAFMSRFILAATLGASYGIYGPAFELCENTPRLPGTEEYLNSEKYELKHWNLQAEQSLEPLITRVNQIRKDHSALQSNDLLEFHEVDSDHLLAYSKTTADGSDTILVVVNVDPFHRHHGWVELPIDDWQLEPDRPYQMHDLITGARYLWEGSKNYIELDPQYLPAHIFRVRRHVQSERDFDYFM